LQCLSLYKEGFVTYDEMLIGLLSMDLGIDPMTRVRATEAWDMIRNGYGYEKAQREAWAHAGVEGRLHT
jgi:hypothetical protein